MQWSAESVDTTGGDATTMPLFEEERMADSGGDPRGVLELVRSATPVARRRAAALAAVARPAGEMAGFLLVEALRSPRARAAALELARSLVRRLADRRPLSSASVGVSVTAWRATVVEESVMDAASVLVRRVEAALVLPSREQPSPER
jgi:hypothetical protein